jgi:hypothetical protein
MDTATKPRSWVPFLREPIDALEAYCDKIADASPNDVKEVARIMLKMIVSYYRDVRWQALLSFIAALVLEVIAVLFFLYAVDLMKGHPEAATLTTVAGVVVQVMTGVVFYFYSQSARQFAGFHICLERTNRFLLANAIVENLPEPERNTKRGEVVTTVLNAPMLTLAMIEKGG